MASTSSPALPFAVIAALVLAGCAGDPGSTLDQPGVPGDASFDETRGGIQGSVTDESLLPLSGAQVALQDASQPPVFTNNEGTFFFSLVEPGKHVLAVDLPGYVGASAAVEVFAGEIAMTSVRLAILASQDAYHTTTIAKGRLGCGVAFQVAGTHQPANLCGAGTDFEYYGVPRGNDQYKVLVPVNGPDVTQLQQGIFETEWVSSQTLASGFYVVWWIEGKVSGVPRVWDYYDGDWGNASRSPVKVLLQREFIQNMIDKAPSFAEKCAPEVISDCSWGGAVYPYADTLGTSSPADFSFYVEQPYTHYVSEFYHEPAPDGFTALPDA